MGTLAEEWGWVSSALSLGLGATGASDREGEAGESWRRE